MDGHAFPHAPRLAHGGSHLLRGELERRREAAAHQRVFARFVDLDEIGAFLQLPANGGHQFSRVVGLRGVGEHALLGIVTDGILVPAQNVDGVAADAQPRPWKQSLVDGIPHRRVSRTRAFRSHVALRREARHQIVARRQDRRQGSLRHGLLHGESGHHIGLCRLLRQNRAPRHGFLDRLQILRAGMQEQMDVSVDQSGQQRPVAQVDDLRSRGMGHRSAGFGDASAHHQDLARCEHSSGLHVQQACGMQHDRPDRRLRLGSRTPTENRQDREHQVSPHRFRALSYHVLFAENRCKPGRPIPRL